MKKINQQLPDEFKENLPSVDSLPKDAEEASSELDDDLLEDVSGGLVQLVNPSSSRL